MTSNCYTPTQQERQNAAFTFNSTRCPVTATNNHVKGTTPNNETHRNPNLLEIVITVANIEIENGNDIRKNGIKANKKPHRTNDENKQNSQFTTLNFYAKIAATLVTQLVTATTNEKKL